MYFHSIHRTIAEIGGDKGGFFPIGIMDNLRITIGFTIDFFRDQNVILPVEEY